MIEILSHNDDHHSAYIQEYVYLILKPYQCIQSTQDYSVYF